MNAALNLTAACNNGYHSECKRSGPSAITESPYDENYKPCDCSCHDEADE